MISTRPAESATVLSESTCRILQGKVLPGDRLGHFELVAYVGGGGMGRVFRATDTQLLRTVALKVLAPDQAADPETLLRFRNEAQSAARLDHENIARVYFVGEDRGVHFIVFEFIEGINLRAHVEQKGPLALEEAIRYSLQIAEALAHAGARNVVHRDIKPSNVLITPDGRVKLIDMGLARLARMNASGADLTASGVTLGTFDYISPEQARDPRSADIRSDIYSFGCTLFYMLAGRPPFPEGTVLQKLLQHQAEQVPDICKVRPELPEEVARVLQKMMAKDPRHRYADPGCLVDALSQLAYQIGLHPVAVGGRLAPLAPEPNAPFFQRHLPWFAPVAALICVVVALELYGSYAVRHEDRQPGWPEEIVALPDPYEVVEGVQANTTPNGLATAKAPREGPPADTVAAKPAVTKRPAGESTPGASDRTTGGSPIQRSAYPVDAAVRNQTLPSASRSAQETSAKGTLAGGLALDGLDGGIVMAEGLSQVLRPLAQRETEPLAGSMTAAVAGPMTSKARDSNVPGPLPDVETIRTGLLIVNGERDGDGQFASLGAACAAANNGDVIELCYHGRHEELPISLSNLRVTIQAGKGYRPVIVFRPIGTESTRPRSMFTLTGSRLTLSSVAIELDVPRDVPSDHWSLFEVRGGQSIRLEECSLTIRNASDQQATYHEDVVFFWAKSVSGLEAGLQEKTMPRLPVSLELINSVVRGEATVLWTEDLQPVDFTWDNGLLVTTERLLTARFDSTVAQASDLFRIDLRHVTAVMHKGLSCTIDAHPGVQRLPMQIHCADSILVGASIGSLIEQEGSADVDEFRRLIAWNGERNFYENLRVFWRIHDLTQEDLIEPMAFEAWVAHWGTQRENLPKLGKVRWRGLPSKDRQIHRHSPSDYVLDEATEESPNLAVGSAGSGRDAGFRADRLPQLPPEPSAQRVERPKSDSASLDTTERR